MALRIDERRKTNIEVAFTGETSRRTKRGDKE